MGANRIDSACWVLLMAGVPSSDGTVSGEMRWHPARLRAWSVDYEYVRTLVDDDFVQVPMQIPVAVVELDCTLCCESVSVDRVCFATEPPVPIAEKRS